MGFWTNHVVRTPQDSWMIQSFEWEIDYDLMESVITDVDEPYVSYGLSFPNPDEAYQWASHNRVKIADFNPIRSHQ